MTPFSPFNELELLRRLMVYVMDARRMRHQSFATTLAA